MINTAVAADFTGEGNWKEKKKKSKDYGKRSTDGGGNRLVQTWQWVSGALLITVCTPSWVDARDCVICCCERRHAGETRKVIGFYCSPNSWHLGQFCSQNPQFWVFCLPPVRGVEVHNNTSVRWCWLLSPGHSGETGNNDFLWLDLNVNSAEKVETDPCIQFRVSSIVAQTLRWIVPWQSSLWSHRGHCVQQEINLGKYESNPLTNEHIVGKVRNIPASAPNETLFTAVRVIIGSRHSELYRAVVADDCNCAAEVPDQSIWKTKVQ